MTMQNRLAKGLTAAAASRFMTLAVQILSIPIMISAWGPSGYGEWIALSAVATYLAYGGLGISPALRGVMVKQLAHGGPDGVRPYFMGAFATLSAIAALLVLAFIAGGVFAPIGKWLNLSRLSPAEITLIISFLSIQLCGALVAGIFMSALAVLGRYGLSDAIIAVRLTVELICIAVMILIFHATPVAIAILLATTSTVTLIAYGLILYRICPAFMVGPGRMKSVAAMMRPMLSTVTTNLFYNGILVQAPRVVISMTLGPAAVATYTVCVQLTRIARIIVEVPSQSPMVEMSTAVHNGDVPQARRLISIFTGVAGLLAFTLALGIVVCGPFAVTLWSAGHVTTPVLLVALLAGGMAVQGLSLPSLEGLISLHQTHRVLPWVLFASVVYVGAGYALTEHYGLLGMAVLSLITETACATVVISQMAKSLGMKPSELIRSAFNFRYMAQTIGPRLLGRLKPRRS